MKQIGMRWAAAAAVACACVLPDTAQGAPQGPPPEPAGQTQPPPPTPGAPNAGQGATPQGAPLAGTQAPGAPAPAPAAPGGGAPILARAFASPTGLIFNAVRPERVADFERALGYFQAALEKSTDAGVRAQAQGWRVMKAAEPGPNGAVVYVFLIDPTVPGADYSLGPILAEAYPNPAELQQIWKLYTSSVTSGGSLMSLTPVKIPPPTGPLTTPVAPPAGAPPATIPPLK